MNARHVQQRQEALAIGEAARALGVTVETLRRWDRGGRVQSFRTPGGQRRFPMSEIDRLRGQVPA